MGTAFDISHIPAVASVLDNMGVHQVPPLSLARTIRHPTRTTTAMSVFLGYPIAFWQPLVNIPISATVRGQALRFFQYVISTFMCHMRTRLMT